MSGGKSARTKGAVGQRIAADMLRDRDWVVDQITAGIAAADLIATDPDGRVYACEVKNTAALLPSHIKQAREQAQKRRKAWMLAWHIPGTSSWLVQRQGALPVVWHQKEKAKQQTDGEYASALYDEESLEYFDRYIAGDR